MKSSFLIFVISILCYGVSFSEEEEGSLSGKAYTCNTELAKHYMERAKKRQADDDPDGAAADYAKAYLFDPKVANQYNQTEGPEAARQWLKKAGQTSFNDEKITCCRKAVKADPNCKDAYLNLGRILFKTKRYDEAADVFHKLLALDPKNKTAQKYLKKTQKKMADGQ
ncbi:MAG: tetratricopeptide repeat protein [Candidatus Aureabacteria bacterium]|nr:tetratricopeptide repeat protein [Candidatus Auribacterota bacterium]